MNKDIKIGSRYGHQHTLKHLPEEGEKVYEKFAELLAKNNKTAYQVSKDTGVSTATLSNWKHDNYRPKVDKLKVLADYFNVPIEYFLEEKR